MDLEELRKTIKVLKKSGARSLEIGDIKIQLRKKAKRIKDSHTKEEPPQAPNPKDFPNLFAENEYSDEEVLFWSTPYYDEIEERQRQLEEKKKQSADLKAAQENKV